MIINQKYIIKEILNKYLAFYKCFGDNENGILFLNYSIIKLNSICKEWRNELMPNLIFPRINITNKDDLAYVVEWIEKYNSPINDIYFPFHHQQTIFKDNFLLPQLTESIPKIANRITSISFRSGKIDYGGTVLLTENTRSCSFGVFNNKEYQKFCNVLENYLYVIEKSLRKLTLTTILYECDIDVSNFQHSIKSLQSIDSLTLASCFQNQIQSLDLIPQLSTSLRKIKLLYINIEYEMLLKMLTIIIEKQQNNSSNNNSNNSSNSVNGNGLFSGYEESEGRNLSYFELNAKFLNHNSNGSSSNPLSHDNGVLWDDESAIKESGWYYLDGLFELVSNWKSLKSFKITMPDETVNVSSVLHFLGSQENLKTFTFIVKLNDDINKDSSSDIDTISSTEINNKSVEKMMIKSFIQSDELCIPMIWDHCSLLNRLELHLDGDSTNEFYKFDKSSPDLEVSLVSLNHPFSNKLLDSIHDNLNIVSIATINELSELDSLKDMLVSNHPTIKKLNFNKSDCENPSALSLIDPIINNNTIQFLYIGGVLSNEDPNYQLDNLELLISILSKNQTLIHLDFSFNPLPLLELNHPKMLQLVQFLESNQTIQSLTINGCWETNTKQYLLIQQTLLKCGKLISYCDNPY